MSVQPISSSNNKNPNFTAANPIIGLMDLIERGGYPARFISQDGLGFLAPRTYKGLQRGATTNEETGKKEYNWSMARKEFTRDLITGPSAFLIPAGTVYLVKKRSGAANNMKLDYINDFEKHYRETLNTVGDKKTPFYEKRFNKLLTDNFSNTDLDIDATARKFAERQVKIEEIMARKKPFFLNIIERRRVNNANKEEIKNTGGTVVDWFIGLRKKYTPGENVLAVKIQDPKAGTISQLLNAMKDYFDDFSKNAKEANILEKFTNRRMGTRVLTNLGAFAAVALFYTQIPKLYNMGLKANPGLKGTAADAVPTQDQKSPQDTQKNGKDVTFGGMSSFLEKTGKNVFNSKGAKKFSNFFELDGPSMPASAFVALLYGFCAPPRVIKAQDKYDRAEILARDLTCFTAILFGAAALKRGFSNVFAKRTGLALNHKIGMESRGFFGKFLDYFNPNLNTRITVFNSKQLESYYTNWREAGINRFMEAMKKNGGNLKKVFGIDKTIEGQVEKIIGKPLKNATDKDFEKLTNASKADLEPIYKILDDPKNKLLKRAKTLNSLFDFLSTLILTPLLIITMTNVCRKMTERRTAQDFGKKTPEQQKNEQNISMGNFLHKK